MAQTALTIIGYVVGGYFGGPVGASAGAAIGGYIGGVISAPDQVGPRILDTAIQQSSYGTGIAKVYGTDRISGTLIWAGPMVEHSDEQSGKGGPTITTFSYTRSLALLLADGPIGAIRRIWADTKLVYDVRDVADDEAQMASALFQSYFLLYTGTESQLPDPTIESIEGTGNVEAYRGRAYIVFTDLPLADFGNRIPQFSVEISPELPVESTAVAYEPLVVYPWALLGQFPYHSVGNTAWGNHVPAGGSTTYTNFGDAVEATRLAGASAGVFWSPSAAYSDTYVDIYTDSANGIYNREGGANAPNDNPQYVWLRTAAEPPESFRIQLPDPSVGDDWLVLTVQVKTWVNYGVIHSGEVIAYRHPNYSVFDPAPAAISPAYQTTYAAGPLGGSMEFLVRGNPVLQVQGERVPTHSARSCLPGDPCQSANGMAEMPGNSDWCISCTGDISPNYDWTIVTGVAKQLCAIEYRAGTLYQNALGPVLLPGDPNYSNSAFWAAALAAAVTAGEAHADVTHPVVVGSYAQRGPFTAAQVAAGAADLADIVRDVCVEAGLTTSQVNVTDLVGQEVLGYTRARRTSARSILEPLRAAYFFDAVESGDVIRFVRRGGAPVATITLDDLAAGPEQTSSDDPVVSDRGQEAELPRVVAVVYKSVTADYQTGTQQARRRVGGTEQQSGTELPIVLTDAHAAQIAEILLYDSWMERNKRTVATWRKWSKLEPTDVILVDDGEFTYRLRATNKSEQQGVISLEARDDDIATYVSPAIGAPVSGGGKEVRVDGPTRYELLDIPLLRQADDSAAFYVAARGYRSDWRGGRLFRSTDGGTSYAAIQDLARTATLGHAETVLGDYAGGNTIDEINAVTVVLVGGGTLETITTAQLLNNGNAAVLGAEVFQFKRAVLTAERTYKLSGLLRGRLGTEQHMGTHEDGDAFTVLDADTLYRPAFELSRVGVELLYKAVSTGVPDTADGQPFTNTAVALKPLSPVHLSVAPAPGGGYAATWVRRTRYLGPWLDGTDVPLGEASESYRVRVLDGDTEVEVQTVTTEAATLGSISSSGALAEVVALSTAAIYLSDIGGGDAAGVVLSSSNQSAVRFNSSGSVVAQSPLLGSGLLQACHGTDAIYVLAFFLSGSTYADSTVYRIPYSAVGTIGASKASAIPGNFQGVAFDGTYLWIAEAGTGLLYRCDATTLATLATYAVSTAAAMAKLYFDGGYLWISELGDEVVQWNVTTHAVVGRLNVTGKRAEQVVVGNGVVFVKTGYLGPSTGMFWSFHLTGSPSLTPIGTNTTLRSSSELALVLLGTDYILAPAFPYGTQVFDAATGDFIASIDVQADTVSGVNGDDVYLTLSGGSAVTRQYTAVDAITAPDFGGLTLEVSQVSATIGPGFPATVTIPEAS
jgi:hypothetical protein